MNEMLSNALESINANTLKMFRYHRVAIRKIWIFFLVLLFSCLFRKTKDAVLMSMFSLGRVMLHSFVFIQIFNFLFELLLEMLQSDWGSTSFI